jgi:hypothetical protein
LPGVKVERNKWLPSLINPEDEREIDVLLTVNPVGYEMRIAVECKNLARPIVVSISGTFEHVSLLDAVSEQWVKTRVRAIFDTAKEHKVTTFSSEEDFQSFMDRPRLLHIVSSRIRLPVWWHNWWRIFHPEAKV